MKKEIIRNGHDKNRFHDIIICICRVLYNTYNERFSLFYCQNRSRACVLLCVTKREGNNTSMMSLPLSFSCHMLNCWWCCCYHYHPPPPPNPLPKIIIIVIIVIIVNIVGSLSLSSSSLGSSWVFVY